MPLTVLFVPGYQEDRRSRDYDATIRAIEAKGYPVEFVPITWKRTTIDDWCKQLEAVYAQFDPARTVLAGFSFGSMTALVTATRIQPKELWLFSLSPYFQEDLKDLKPAWLTRLGARRVESFHALRFSRLVSELACSTKLFAGELEMKKYPDLQRRFAQASQQIVRCESIVVEGAGHAVEHPNYIKAIEHSI